MQKLFPTSRDVLLRAKRLLAFLIIATTAILPAPSTRAAADTLTVGVVGLPRGLGHPYVVSNLPAIYTFTALYDALTFVENDGTLKPWLATAWRQTSATTWEFDLRPNVTFSNGEKFDAAAVAAVVAYITSPAAVADTTTAELSSIASARVLAPLKVEITTRMPNPMLAREVSALRIVAPDAWKRLGPDGYAKAPVGTGPFQVESWAPARITFTAFKGSWRPPKVERLELLALPELSARTQGLLSGRIDIATALRVEDKAVIEEAGHRVQANPGTGVFAIILNLERDPRFRDIRVREALNLAVNRNRIAEVLLQGLIHPASQFTPPNATGFDPALKPYPYDPTRARALLKEAGYPDGFSFIFEGVMGGAISDGAIFQQIAADLAAVGVKMEIRSILLSQLSANMHSPTGWTGTAFGVDYGTAPSLDSLRALKLHSCLHRFVWYCDKDIQPTLDKALATPSAEERQALTKDVMRRYYEQKPAILLWDIVYFDGIRREVGEVPAVGSWILYDRITKKP